ncbi:hypothetical protein [Sphingomonas sp. BE137]|uniref:hypothetical protein n=1 Tax=Sphingomonas sp. BE137 TaxID=2817844 RepID=UPI001AE531B7|nr:hypothetical protein [Sphingomonas sp. BE137]MDR6850149.1 hypothetical protein [Sphingomonas sp. BE137]
MLKFEDLVDGALYEILYEDGTGVGCAERSEIADLAGQGVLGAPLDGLWFTRLA